MISDASNFWKKNVYNPETCMLPIIIYQFRLYSSFVLLLENLKYNTICFYDFNSSSPIYYISRYIDYCEADIQKDRLISA